MLSLAAASSRSFRPCSTSFLPSLTRTLVNRALNKPIPSPTEDIVTPKDFLNKIGRDIQSKMSFAPESWDDFWRLSGLDMRKAGMGVKDRRYTLWCMSKFRRGIPVEEFAHEMKPKKTVRGWGPSVQNGKRIRSKIPKHLRGK
ncbi:hypothetical protein GYMLUDRAFT_763299 [Collybiopsis luxurians FD-317 M1]|uniref:Small ribosomal subunit protein mS41 n=1 Tax=Collybiopsis luxurians FD-317 M1 TaxID=944289 RepID=A0A0D0B1X2_9AGAR|nr:hypothetical protein GYMLUDRAFT_763299 [Collybiopsis luxurians FD-317 M1]